MKRLFYLFTSVAITVGFASCSLDDDGANFYYAPLEIVNAQVPDTFEYGKVYTINVDLLRPDDCTMSDTFDVRRSATDSTNIRTVSAIGIVLEKDECEEVSEEIRDSFQFEVIYNDPYIFRFYSGDNENGDPEFIEVEVPVK
ncbi:hypothetical protein [Pseudozobellia thermophila]|uniref:Lipoprotein n=1 Tax=Pseudozobellia thermophila TaxID=192903 RepID=A0A1M6BS29_9FLAO|nr:hypothetical protein [Pseudozobellia thermophila]SHI51565.1 hypothetical protein SAMN04488513_101518 [Pseudozobellia thermophila]